METAFNEWLLRKSWAQGVRYCKVVAVLMLPASIAINVPLLRGDGWAGDHWLVAWQLGVEAVCLAMLWVNRYLPRMAGREAPLYAFCALFMLLTTWAGVRAGLIGGGGLVVYAAGSTFIASAICTPRPVRRPMYAFSLLALAVTAGLQQPDAQGVIAALVHPFCVVVLCIELDKVTLARSVELYSERQKAERERERADKVLYNVLPATIADELKRSGKVNAVKFENMGVLFADIVGFTRFSRSLPPDALVLVLNEIFSAFDELVERHGLEKIKTIGDAYMVVSHHRLDAMGELALQILKSLEAYNRANGTALAMRIGIHAGPAVAGVIGVKRFLYDVWGDTVNLASRMESSGEPGAVHVTDAVYQQTRERFEFAAREPVEIKGRGLMPTYWLQGILADRGGVERVGTTHKLPETNF